jgi:PAS domain S-box-containing protein
VVKTRVLLVEDNSGDADLFRLALSKAAFGSFEVESVERMSAAVARLPAGRFDVVVLDLSLPDSSGIETLRTMRRAAPVTPIVVLTGNEDERVGHQALNEGAQDYIRKGDLEGRAIARALLFAIERRLFQEQLNRRDVLLAEAQRIAMLGSFDWDVVKNEITVSDELCRIYGVERDPGTHSYEDLMGRTHPDDHERVRMVLQMALGSRQSFECEYRILRSGETVVLHSRGQVVLDDAGTPKRLVGTCQDITERRKLEGTLILAGRMSSIGTLASGIAHEINNPLSYVISNLEFIGQELHELALGPGQRLRELTEVVDHARQGAERVSNIVRGLKIFSRADVEEKREAVELKHVLELAIDLTFHEIRHRARLVKTYGPAPFVEGDEARLSQVFVHLLVNAAQAIGDGAVDDNEICVLTATDSTGRAVVEIRDTGCGIPEVNRTQIFDPFFTTKPVGLGTGLGLSIIHGILTDHGGEITFENSRVGRGATFRVVLPAALRDSSPVHLSSRPAIRVAPGRRGTILVVDDDLLVATALRRVLTAEHDVVTAANGREAMDRFDRGERFDVVLCDIMMPVMNGVALFEEVSLAAPRQADKFVFISGGAFTPAAKSFLDRVPNPRLEKPFESTNLRAVVRSLVAEELVAE